MQHERIQELATRLTEWKEVSSGQWAACCPAHEDSDPSFHVAIDEAGGKLLINCKKGCTTQAILQSLGWTYTSLFLNSGADRKHRKNGHHPTKRKIESVYPYRDEHGAELYEVLRFDPKEFRQRRREDGSWVYNLKGTRRVLYRLPELTAADPELPVLLVEGEKKVDLLRVCGFVATCNPGGAAAIGSKTKWSDDYSEMLKGRHVVIMPDNDEPGRAHVQTVGRSLLGRAASVRVLILPDLPPKGDICDWIKLPDSKPEVLRELIASAPLFEPAESTIDTGPICNVEFEAGGEVAKPVAIATILKRMLSKTDDWPRRVADMLFVHEPGRQLSWIDKVPSLFGWIGERTGKPAYFERRADCHSKDEFFHHLQRRATEYKAIELYPHEPRLDGHYYACADSTTEGTGEALGELISFFYPATDIDRDLITCLFATLIWGGPPGDRPVFLITSDEGRGVGKTTLATLAASLVGGHIEITKDSDVEVIKQRLLSSEGIVRRAVILDNVKTLKFSWAELESLITTRVISGKKMYVGEYQRPNNLTWIITLNGASLGTDMAERVVTIKLARPTHSDDWGRDVAKFIEARRWDIIADIRRLLRWKQVPLKTHSRWGDWEGHVLARLADPVPVQHEILRRQVLANVESEESEELEGYFWRELELLGYDPWTSVVFIKSLVVHRWYCHATKEKHSVVGVSRIMYQRISEGSIRYFAKYEARTLGRGVLWVGPKSEHAEILTPRDDLEERLAAKAEGYTRKNQNTFEHWDK